MFRVAKAMLTRQDINLDIEIGYHLATKIAVNK